MDWGAAISVGLSVFVSLTVILVVALAMGESDDWMDE